MLVLQCMDASGECIDRIVREYGAARLKDRSTMIVFLVHIMNGDAALCFFCDEHGFVNSFAIHTLATECRQQCRMNIYDMAFELLQ